MSKFKVGDRVKGIGCTTLYSHNIGKLGTVQHVGAYYLRVRFDGGEEDEGHLGDFEPFYLDSTLEALKAGLVAAVEAGEEASIRNSLGALGKAAFAKELLEKHFNLVRVPATAAKWAEKESAA